MRDTNSKRLKVLVTENHLQCPHCGSTQISAVEDVIRWWSEVSVVDGVILIDSLSDNTDLESGKDPRYECRRCWNTLDDPEGEREVGYR